MSNEFEIQYSVQRLLRCLDVVPDAMQAVTFADQLSNNVAPFVFTQVSAHNAKRKIAEFSPKPEAFLLKYEELKGRNVRGLDPLIQLLSMIVSTEGMATKMAPRLAPVIQLDSSIRSSNLASLANSGRTKLSDSELAKIKENLLRDKDIGRLLSSSSMGNLNLNASYSSESKRQKLKSSIVKKNSNLPTLPAWCHEQGFLTHDYVPRDVPT